MNQLKLLVILSVLSAISLIFLIIALTDFFPFQKLTENRTVVALIFLMFAGFTRQAYIRYKNQ